MELNQHRGIILGNGSRVLMNDHHLGLLLSSFDGLWRITPCHRNPLSDGISVRSILLDSLSSLQLHYHHLGDFLMLFIATCYIYYIPLLVSYSYSSYYLLLTLRHMASLPPSQVDIITNDVSTWLGLASYSNTTIATSPTPSGFQPQHWMTRAHNNRNLVENNNRNNNTTAWLVLDGQVQRPGCGHGRSGPVLP